MHRRQVIGSTVWGLLWIPGCLANDDGPEAPSTDTPEPEGPVRGDSAADVDRRVVEDSSCVELLEDTDEVRYNRQPDSGRTQTETKPFDEWARLESARAAAEAAADHVHETLGTRDFSHGTTSSIDGEDPVAILEISTIVTGSGSVSSEPSITFDELVSSTPESVDVTYVLEEREYSASIPVYASHEVLYED